MEQGAYGVGTLCEPFFFMNNVKICVFFSFFSYFCMQVFLLSCVLPINDEKK